MANEMMFLGFLVCCSNPAVINMGFQRNGRHCNSGLSA